jgi:hypothetical protein
MTVKNLNGTSDNTCECNGGWLAHWENFNEDKKKATYCVGKNCFHPATYGGHVQKDDPNDRHWYIIPICEECNKKRGDYVIKDGIELVPANVSETCGK